MTAPDGRPLLLLVGGGGGLVGRSVLAEFAQDWAIRSVHRHPVPEEKRRGVEWIGEDAGLVAEWDPLLDGIDVVLTLAWYRPGRDRRFAPLTQGLLRLLDAARRKGTPRFAHLSVPDAPADLEENLPYLALRRRFDLALEKSGISHVMVRPTMLFGPGDRLLTVMLRQMRRYRMFPLFGDGEYHVSPLAVRDLARILRAEIGRPGSRNVLAGGPRRWRYRDLTDRMFEALGQRPRYWHLSPRNSVRLASAIEHVGSSLLYKYEVEWLLSDMLGLPPYAGLDPPLADVEPFIEAEGARMRGQGAPASS
ncbi:MAG: NAD-dependent epimerase/dehydratase family protein [Thermoplasmata archaeon]